MKKKILSLIIAVTVVFGALSSAVISYAVVDESCLYGDINDNGRVDTDDARLALMAAAGIADLSDIGFERADINNDEAVTIYDARQILKAAVGIGNVKLQPSGAFFGFDGGDVFSSKAELVEYFNSHLNEVKTQKAGFTYKTNSDFNTADFTIGSATILGTAIPYDTSKITSSIANSLFSKTSEDNDMTKTVFYGEENINIMPIEGQRYVSALTESDLFGATASADGSKLTIKIALADVDRQNVTESAYARVLSTEIMGDSADSVLGSVFSALPTIGDGTMEQLYYDCVLKAVFDIETGRVISYDQEYSTKLSIKEAGFGLSSFTVIGVQNVKYSTNVKASYYSFTWD